jgi:hypothetical protein
VRGHSGDAAREDLAALGDEALQKIGVLEIDRVDGEIDAAPRHRAVRTAEI